MRELTVIGEHTVDVTLLTPGGWALDAGCRDFKFARGMVERGCRVLAVDADPTVRDPGIPGVTYFNVALAVKSGERRVAMTADPQARFVLGEQPPRDARIPVVSVDAVTLHELMLARDIGHFDVVKLDIEGAEIGVLRNWQPVATQLSVEFHEHVFKTPQPVYDEIFVRLKSFGYEVVRHVKEARHCAAPSYWDSLFIRKANAPIV